MIPAHHHFLNFAKFGQFVINIFKVVLKMLLQGFWCVLNGHSVGIGDGHRIHVLEEHSL